MTTVLFADVSYMAKLFDMMSITFALSFLLMASLRREQIGENFERAKAQQAAW